MTKTIPLYPPPEFGKDRVLITERSPSYIRGEWRPKGRMLTRAIRNIEWIEDDDPRYCHWKGTVTFLGEEVEVTRYRFAHSWSGTVWSVERRWRR